MVIVQSTISKLFLYLIFIPPFFYWNSCVFIGQFHFSCRWSWHRCSSTTWSSRETGSNVFHIAGFQSCDFSVVFANGGMLHQIAKSHMMSQAEVSWNCSRGRSVSSHDFNSQNFFVQHCLFKFYVRIKDMGAFTCGIVWFAMRNEQRLYYRRGLVTQL